MTALKACTECRIDKPADTAHFVARASRRDGLDNACRDCRRAQNREYKRRLRITGVDAPDRYARSHVDIAIWSPRPIRAVYDREAALKLWPMFLAGEISREALLAGIDGGPA